MRILYVSHAYPPSPQRFVAEEVIAWRRLGLEVVVLSLTKPDANRRHLLPGPLAEETQRTTYLSELQLECWFRGVRMAARRWRTFIPATRKVWFGPYLRHSSWRLRIHSFLTWWRALGAIGFAQQSAFDGVHADFADDSATVAWLVSMTNELQLTFRDHFSFNPQLLKEKVDRSSLVLVCSAKNRDAITRTVGTELGKRAVVNYVGVDTSVWSPCDADPEHRLLICVGTLQEKKGQRYLVEACQLLKERGIDCSCLLVGDGPDRDSLTDLIRSLRLQERVSITGYLSAQSVRELICRATVHCLPSTLAANGDSDGIPVALMETMASARPCISTAVGGIDELIDNGCNGFVIPERDPTALAEAAATLLEDPMKGKRMGHMARQKIETVFDRKLTALHGKELLEQCLAYK